jgi:type VI secretion system protein ImpF
MADPGTGLSLLDRLFDFQPGSQVEAPMSDWEQSRLFKASLCRDLAALLNTRRAERDFDAAFEEATDSLLSFGITDFTAYNLKSGADQEQVRRSIERSIRRFEPRLTRVSVSIAEPDLSRPVLKFQIDALLHTGSPGEPIAFDVALHRESRRVAVSRGNA